MIKNTSYVGGSKLVIVCSQLVFIVTFAKHLPVEELGLYSLALATVTPMVWAVFFDVPIKIISSSLETKNLFVILFPNALLFSLLGLLIVGICVFTKEANVFYLMVLVLFGVKFSEVISEIEYANLRREEKFQEFSLISSVRFLVIYASGSLAIIFWEDMVNVLVVILVLAVFFAGLSINRLIKVGWKFQIHFHDLVPYMLRNRHLGVASGIKFISANSMRYFVSFQFGVSSLGYMTPIFYGLTGLSSISTIFDNVFSPKILKSIGKDNAFVIRQHKGVLVTLLSVSICIAFGAFFLSEWYYGLFYEVDKGGYHHLLMVFALGWFFYVARAILRAVSYRLGLQKLQVRIQISFMFILILLMYVLSLVFGMIGVALAFVLSSAFVTIYYMKAIRNELRLKGELNWL